MKVLIVGDAPSKTNTYKYVAFMGSKCWPRLKSWLDHMGLGIPIMINSHKPGQLASDLHFFVNKDTKVIAIGLNASKRLKRLNVEHYMLPHPSGLNRQINDPKLIALKLKECYSYIHESTK